MVVSGFGWCPHDYLIMCGSVMMRYEIPLERRRTAGLCSEKICRVSRVTRRASEMAASTAGRRARELTGRASGTSSGSILLDCH